MGLKDFTKKKFREARIASKRKSAANKIIREKSRAAFFKAKQEESIKFAKLRAKLIGQRAARKERIRLSPRKPMSKKKLKRNTTSIEELLRL